MIVQKFIYSLFTLIAAISLVSAIIYLAPVDPARLTMGQRADAMSIEAKKNELGLNQSPIFRLIAYLNDISPISVHTLSSENEILYNYIPICPIANHRAIVLKKPYLRRSFQTGRKVSAILAEAFPTTFALAFAALSIGLILGIPFGIVAALNKNTWIDHFLISIATLGISLPSYVMGILIAVLFGVVLKDWTGLSYKGSLIEILDDGREVFMIKNLLLPAFALGIRPLAIITELVRGSMLEILNEDYIRTAKAKGLSAKRIFFRHALRPALNPVISAASGWFASLLTGAFFIEAVFEYDGIGTVAVQALREYDVPVVLGAVLLTAFIFNMVNLLTDWLYTYIDPRIKWE